MLKGRVAIVTGSTSGIGLGIARGLAAEGCDIMLNGFGDPCEIEKIRAGIEKELGVTALYNGADLSKGEQCAQLVADAEKRLGKVDILVNNAGIQHVSPVESFPVERWDAIIAINMRDSYTDGHCRRVTENCLSLVDRIDTISEYEKDVLRVVGPIHDLGKIGIPDAILLKPGKLSDEEYAMMKGHSVYGEEIMNRFDILANEAKIIRHHHERYDGKGYPDSLAGTDIPLCSRVIAVCDTFDAMVTNRPYRTALKQSDAVAEIARCKGFQFDENLADIFLEMVRDGTWE